MPLCRVNVDRNGCIEPRQIAELISYVKELTPSAPVILLIHGFKFSPFLARKSPHSHILSLDPAHSCRKAISWPRKLGVGSGDPGEPLCIAFGWEARGPIWRAYDRAAQSGEALARLVSRIGLVRPGQQVHVVAHSLGCRVALSALPHLPPGAVGRLILLAPAETRSAALKFLESPAGRAVDCLNVGSRQNRPFDRLFEWLVAPLTLWERSLGAGLGQSRRNWVDLNIDDCAARDRLRRLGFPIAAADRRICHWSVYLRPGLFALYRAVLAGGVKIEALRALPEARTETPRWVRLLQACHRPLPFVRRQPF